MLEVKHNLSPFGLDINSLLFVSLKGYNSHNFSCIRSLGIFNYDNSHRRIDDIVALLAMISFSLLLRNLYSIFSENQSSAKLIISSVTGANIY